LAELDPSVSRIAAAFVRLQEQRHLADYDPFFPISRRAELEAIIVLAETAIQDVERLAAPTDLEFAAHLLTVHRK
jgi:hypothetical protein